jgi:hypothetical protein
MELIIATEIAIQALSLETRTTGRIGKGSGRREEREMDVEDSF